MKNLAILLLGFFGRAILFFALFFLFSHIANAADSKNVITHIKPAENDATNARTIYMVMGFGLIVGISKAYGIRKKGTDPSSLRNSPAVVIKISDRDYFIGRESNYAANQQLEAVVRNIKDVSISTIFNSDN